MLRESSPTERVLTYATFLAISLAIHMVVILGDRSRAEQSAAPPPPTHRALRTSGGAPR